jgi:hypothetical protein
MIRAIPRSPDSSNTDMCAPGEVVDVDDVLVSLN